MSEPLAEEVPSYEDAVGNVRQTRAHSRRLSRSTVSHSFRVRDLTLKFESYAASSEAFPVLFTNSIINGQIVWNLSKEEAPLSISISVEGWIERTALVSQSASAALDRELAQSLPFWKVSKEFLAPEVHDSEPTTFGPGQHTYDFSFKIPASYVPLETNYKSRYHVDATDRLFELPPTFRERGKPYTIQYAVVASIKRRRFKLDHQVRAQFRFMAVSIPDTPASPIRLDSYRLNVPLPPPEFDTLGYTNTDVTLQGRFSGTPFDLRCSAYLALPVQYPTGSPINFFLKLANSAGDAPSYGSDEDVERPSSSTPPPPSGPRSIVQALSAHDVLSVSLYRVLTVDGTRSALEFVTKGTLWESDFKYNEVVDGMEVKLLQGEIPLDSTLVPDFVFPCFELGYQVQIELNPLSAKPLKIASIDPPIATTTSSTFTFRNRRSPTLSSDSITPILSIPVQLTNASRLGEPKSRSYIQTSARSVSPPAEGGRISSASRDDYRMDSPPLTRYEDRNEVPLYALANARNMEPAQVLVPQHPGYF